MNVRYYKIDTSSGNVFFADTKKNVMYQKSEFSKRLEKLGSTPGAFCKFRLDITKMTEVDEI